MATAAGDDRRALTFALERLDIERSGGLGYAHSLADVAFALLEVDRVDEALDRAREALVEAQRTGVAHALGEAYRCIAWCSLLRDEVPQAALCLLGQLDVYDHAETMAALAKYYCTVKVKDIRDSGGGEWISSSLIERVISSYDGVVEVAVIVVPDEKWTEGHLLL